MTPKAKAEELVNKFLLLLFGKKPFYSKSDYFKAKKCATICVDEILEVLGGSGVYGFADPAVEHYWESVKTEIKKLIS